MTAVHDEQRRGGRRDLGHLAFHGHGVARPRDQVVHRHAHLDRAAQHGELGPEQVGQLAKHAERLPLLGGLGLGERVAQLDRVGGLDEERSRAARLVVHDARGPAARVAANRDHVAPAPHRDRGLRGSGAGVEPPEQRFEPPDQAVACRVHFAPRRRERGTRGVEQRPVRIEGLLQPALDRLVGEWLREGRGERRCSAYPAEIGVDEPRGDEDPVEIGELDALEHAPLDTEPGEGTGDVGDRLGEERVAPAEQPGHLADPRELAADPVEVVGRRAARGRARRPAARPRARRRARAPVRTRSSRARRRTGRGAKETGCRPVIWAGTPSG